MGVAGAATSRAPQCLSVLRMDITFDETDSTRRYPYISRNNIFGGIHHHR